MDWQNGTNSARGGWPGWGNAGASGWGGAGMPGWGNAAMSGWGNAGMAGWGGAGAPCWNPSYGCNMGWKCPPEPKPTATVYGGLYSDATQTLTIPAGGTVQLTLEENMPAKFVSLGPSALGIGFAGDYAVDFMILLQSTSDAFGLAAGVTVNGVFAKAALTTATVLGSAFQSISVHAIATLAAGDVLTLALSSQEGGTVLFGPGMHSNLSVTRIG